MPPQLMLDWSDKGAPSAENINTDGKIPVIPAQKIKALLFQGFCYYNIV